MDNFLWRWKNCEILFKYQEILFKLWLFLFHKSLNTLFEAGVLEEQAKISSILPPLNCSPFLEGRENPTRWCTAASFWRSRTSSTEMLKQSALSSPLSSSLSLGWIYSTSEIWQMSRCLRGHVPTFELGATSWQWQQPCALRVVTTSGFEVLPFSYLLLHAACDTWVCVLQLSPFKSAGIWSNAGHPGERGKSWTKCSSSIKPLECQCRLRFPATFSSKTSVMSELFIREEQRQLPRPAT